MKLLQQGDPCPCCGEPIKTADPDILLLLSILADKHPAAEKEGAPE